VGSICRLIMCPVWVARSRSLGWSLYGLVGIQVEGSVCLGVLGWGLKILRWVGGGLWGVGFAKVYPWSGWA
jgi:hypothetical protein